jgi:hypothetical protein
MKLTFTTTDFKNLKNIKLTFNQPIIFFKLKKYKFLQGREREKEREKGLVVQNGSPSLRLCARAG